MDADEGSGPPTWLRGLITSVAATMAMIALTVGFGWEAAVALAKLILENDVEHLELSVRIDALEGEACDAWLQDDRERDKPGEWRTVTRRPRPPWCHDREGNP